MKLLRHGGDCLERSSLKLPLSLRSSNSLCTLMSVGIHAENVQWEPD